MLIMKRFNKIILFILAGFSAQESHAILPEYHRTVAVGAGYTYSKKANGTEKSYNQYSPEVFAYYYYRLPNQLLLRPGLRFGHTEGNEPDGASTVSISESDLRSCAELTLLWGRNSVLPAFTLGGGALFRKTTLTAQTPVVSSASSITGSDTLPFIQGQASVIFQLFQGRLEVAPFARYTHILSDTRLGWYFGLESSISLF